MSEIPDGEILYRYARPDAFPPEQKEIPGFVFNDPEMSCDWERYQKAPEHSFHIAEGKTRILEITVCDEIRNPRNPSRDGEKVAAWQQKILHDPVDHPKHGFLESHSLIKGKKKKAVTDAIAENSRFYQ